MIEDDDTIPTEGMHRGVPLHAGQDAARLTAVKRDIDRAHDIHTLEELVAFADSPSNAPEGRLLARAKALAMLDDVVARRGHRSRNAALSRQRVKASCAGLASRRWQSRTHYCSLLDAQPGPDCVGPKSRNTAPAAMTC